MKDTSRKTKSGHPRRIKRLFAAIGLRRLAGTLCLATTSSEEAGDEVLYHLPGIFTLEIEAPEANVRLIKEAHTLRILKKSEKSVTTLRIRLEDLAILGDIVAKECTLQKALAEGRMTFSGKTKYLAALLRAGAAGDKRNLTSGEYAELYGKRKED